jgi:hypothetical protein
VIILRHFRRILRAYLAYYHRSRTHFALAKDAPDRRPSSSGAGTIVVTPEMGGLHRLICVMWCGVERRDCFHRASGGSRVTAEVAPGRRFQNFG